MNEINEFLMNLNFFIKFNSKKKERKNFLNFKNYKRIYD